MFSLSRMLRPAHTTLAAERLFALIVEASRRPAFYRDWGVPDTLDGRFEMISLHGFLVLRRLRAAGRRGQRLSQAVFDRMFADMDRSLREMGAGDLGVGRRVKAMARGFYGRIAAYDAALADGEAPLREALARNLFGTVEASPLALAAAAHYLRREAAALGGLAEDRLLAGDIAFGHPDSFTPSQREVS